MEPYDELGGTDVEQYSHQLTGLFRDITLSLGGIFYAYPVPDEAVWETARSLDRIFRNAMKFFNEDSDNAAELTRHSQGRKHPAIAELLRRLDEFEVNSVQKREGASL